MVRWRIRPRDLIPHVKDFSSLPGVPDYASVRDHWTQSPPWFHGAQVTLADIAAFAKRLLHSDPFGTGDSVPYVDFNYQVSEAKVVSITQRQLAFIVVNILFGNDIVWGSGLRKMLKRCKGTTGHLYSMLSFLAILSQELQELEHGSTLIAATPKSADDSWRDRLMSHELTPPSLCMDGAGKHTCNLTDFMDGGVDFQAVTDIAGGSLGGGAGLCDIANTQEESLVQFYSEVVAFAFFAGGEQGLLPVPLTFLGVRRYVNQIGGESTTGPPYDDKCGVILKKNWLNERIRLTADWVDFLGTISTSRIARSAFVAVASCGTEACMAYSCKHEDKVNNVCDTQRRHLDHDLRLWYQAYEPSMYDLSIQGAFRKLVRRIGTGPWGAGAWLGDSQQSFLTVWLATSLLNGPTMLDYYVYNRFCENPGNQCFVLAGKDCETCILGSHETSLWKSQCGHNDVHSMIAKFAGKPASTLHSALSKVHGPPAQVFDLL